MELSSSLFWDTDVGHIDWEHHAQYVINRVLMRGTLQDWFEIKKHYGVERIKAAALESRYLDKVTLSFCCAYFNLSKDSFRCSIAMPLIRQLWDY